MLPHMEKLLLRLIAVGILDFGLRFRVLNLEAGILASGRDFVLEALI